MLHANGNAICTDAGARYGRVWAPRSTASAPYLHSGAAATLDAVLENVTHRSVGRADGLETLTDPHNRKELVRFLESIDRDTEPFLGDIIPPRACGPQ